MDENDSPAENTKDEIKHEEGSNHNQRNKESPVKNAAQCIICLK